MCGLAGFVAASTRDSFEAEGLSMAEAIRHRGPDDAGVWADRAAGVCLAHRRLSIIDLSAAGHQPMHSSAGRYVIAFNGEIYNHLEIRAELQAADASPDWRGHSDTETLLAAFEHWGVSQTLEKIVGMFAIALWDRSEKQLTLARDRFGEKPLYFGWAGAGTNRAFVFASELKAIRKYPGFDNKVSRDGLALYLQYSTVPAPYSIYEDIYKLPPGCRLTLSEEGLRTKEFQISEYWRLSDVARRGIANPYETEQQALIDLEAVLRKAVELQAVADVPIGAFLSGGVDSSTIVALMQTQSSRPVQTFTAGFDEKGFDESVYAEAIARHLGTEHHELRVRSADAISLIQELPNLWDEPFADSSQIPTFLICKAARQRVTVALSGDAGDELFGGYTRYYWAKRIWSWVGWMPPDFRRFLGHAIERIPVERWDALAFGARSATGVARLGDKAHKMAHRLKTADNLDDIYRSLVTVWPVGTQIVRGSSRLATKLDDNGVVAGIDEAIARMMLWDSVTYLPDDILTKVDRAAMGVSLETRIPFLDHRVSEVAWRMPLDMKIRDGKGKWLLRELLYKYVPREMIERPKVGFAIPLAEWLRGPLRDWAENLLQESRLASEGFFDPAPIRATWSEHLKGRHDWSPRLWTVLMFQAWLEANR